MLLSTGIENVGFWHSLIKKVMCTDQCYRAEWVVYLFVLIKSYVKSFFVSEGAIFSSVTCAFTACLFFARRARTKHTHRKKRKIDSWLQYYSNLQWCSIVFFQRWLERIHTQCFQLYYRMNILYCVRVIFKTNSTIWDSSSTKRTTTSKVGSWVCWTNHSFQNSCFVHPSVG